jgi:hypothetical protein
MKSINYITETLVSAGLISLLKTLSTLNLSAVRRYRALG